MSLSTIFSVSTLFTFVAVTSITVSLNTVLLSPFWLCRRAAQFAARLIDPLNAPAGKVESASSGAHSCAICSSDRSRQSYRVGRNPPAGSAAGYIRFGSGSTRLSDTQRNALEMAAGEGDHIFVLVDGELFHLFREIPQANDIGLPRQHFSLMFRNTSDTDLLDKLPQDR